MCEPFDMLCILYLIEVNTKNAKLKVLQTSITITSEVKYVLLWITLKQLLIITAHFGLKNTVVYF